MQVRTFTSFWNQDRKLYALNDVKLPAPVSLRVLAVAFGTGLPWCGLLALLHVPFDLLHPWYLLWFGPPVILGGFAGRPIYQGKTIFEYAQSRLSYIFIESKRYKGLEPETEEPGSRYLVEQAIFTRPDVVAEEPIRRT